MTALYVLFTPCIPLFSWPGESLDNLPSGGTITQTCKNAGNIVSPLFIFSQALIALAESTQGGQSCLPPLGELSVLDLFLSHLFPHSYFPASHLSFGAGVKLVLSCGENGIFICLTPFCFQVVFYLLLTARLREEWGSGCEGNGRHLLLLLLLLLS